MTRKSYFTHGGQSVTEKQRYLVKRISEAVSEKKKARRGILSGGVISASVTALYVIVSALVYKNILHIHMTLRIAAAVVAATVLLMSLRNTVKCVGNLRRLNLLISELETKIQALES